MMARDGAVLYQTHLLVDSNFPTLINLNGVGIDTVDFQSDGGVPRGSGPGTQFVLDNLTIAPASVPGPIAGLPGLLTAVAAFIGWRRSRRALATDRNSDGSSPTKLEARA
jgi:hypothetical protein